MSIRGGSLGLSAQGGFMDAGPLAVVAAAGTALGGCIAAAVQAWASRRNRREETLSSAETRFQAGLQRQIDQLTGVTEHQASRIDGQETQIGALRGEINDLRIKLFDSHAEKRRLETEKAVLEARLTELEAELASARMEREACRGRILELESLIASEKAKVRHLETRLLAVPVETPDG